MGKEKVVLQEFIDVLTEMLTHWSKSASKLSFSTSASAEIIPMEFIVIIKLVNVRLGALRKELKINYEYYKSLEEKYGLKPLSLAYLESYSILTKNLTDALAEVTEVASKYNSILQSAHLYNVDIDKYINLRNQNALDRISKLTLENLLELLNDKYLLGL